MKQKRMFFLGIILLVIGVTFVVGYVTAKNTALSVVSPRTVTLTVTPSPAIGVKVYTSSAFGMTFQYKEKSFDQPVGVVEKENRIYVYHDNGRMKPEEGGQWVEFFTKEPKDTLAQAIETRFLKEYNKKNCYVEPYTTKYPYETAHIAFPLVDDPDLPSWANASKCPEEYTASNWIGYFLMDKNHPERFYFFSIGQYAIESGIDGKAWQDTVSFF